MYIHVHEPKCTVQYMHVYSCTSRPMQYIFVCIFLEGKKKKHQSYRCHRSKKSLTSVCWRAMKSLLIFYEIHMTFIEIFKNQVAILMPDFISKNIIWRKRD